ncbi:hypothetical protein GOBAR_DD28618 [Gossypium barbadense]|nr:hypothetical protein GOBAR_DD28618 [Gossypium barbadense]
MKRVLFRGISLTTRNILHSYTKTQFTRSTHSPLQLGLDSESASVAEAHVKDVALSVEDVSNKGDEEALPSVLEAILRRKLAGKHEESDDELMDELEKWDEMIKEAVQHGYPKDTKECEEILKDMLSWDKLLPALDVQTMMEEAKSRWLRPNVIHAILCNHKYFPIYMKPVNLPKSNF